jgi:hypothetical protein
MTAVRGTEYCAAPRHDASRPAAIEQHVVSGRKQAFEAIEKPQNFPAQLFGREDDTPKHRVQTRTIATARQDADPGLGHLGG